MYFVSGSYLVMLEKNYDVIHGIEIATPYF